MIATRSGEDGTSGLGYGSRRPKHAPRLAALCDVDELNAMLGTLRAENVPAHIDAGLTAIQHNLFDLGAELCIPGNCTIFPEHVARLDDMLARYKAALPPLQEFVLPWRDT